MHGFDMVMLIWTRYLHGCTVILIKAQLVLLACVKIWEWQVIAQRWVPRCEFRLQHWNLNCGLILTLSNTLQYYSTVAFCLIWTGVWPVTPLSEFLVSDTCTNWCDPMHLVHGPGKNGPKFLYLDHFSIGGFGQTPWDTRQAWHFVQIRGARDAWRPNWTKWYSIWLLMIALCVLTVWNFRI